MCMHHRDCNGPTIRKGVQLMFTFMLFFVFCGIVCLVCKILTSAIFWKILGWCFVLGCVFCLIGALL